MSLKYKTFFRVLQSNNWFRENKFFQQHQHRDSDVHETYVQNVKTFFTKVHKKFSTIESGKSVAPKAPQLTIES